MNFSVRELLKSRGIVPKEEHLDMLETRRKELWELRDGLKKIHIDETDISLRNVPGGDHVE
ncbi:MAG TPA: hypothetical protein VK108_06505 [Pseudogracilibacillus sp.]|nr:hypothetical protein [Pseudogracilibacillus sp.]